MSEYIERYWRDAKPADAIKEPPMVARFRDNGKSDEDWVIGKLIYWDRSRWPWNSETWNCFECCQVYDAPDPGEGWRLIDPEKDKPQEGDEIYDRETCTWRRRLTKFQSWALSINRRRIEQPKPEPRYEPFRWEDREQLRGRWIFDSHGGEYCICRLQMYQESFFINSVSADDALKEWTFCDTGEPVGRRVE